MAFLRAVVSTSNGSPASSPDFGAAGRPPGEPGFGAPPCGRDDAAGDFAAPPAAGDPEEGRAGPEDAAGFFGAAAVGFPDIEAPQNGQSSTSSSRTEALQAGQLRKSMISLHT